MDFLKNTLSAGAKYILKISGWKLVGHPNINDKCVMILAYHTSNWDAPIALLANLALKANSSWLGKHSLFWWPLGTLLRALGGIPIRRDSKEDLVSQVVEVFNHRSQFVLGLAPEGTRGKVDKWKSGFYYIALNAKVPIQPVAFDYASRSLVFGPVVYPTGAIDVDIAQIREFLRPFSPKFLESANKDFTI